MLRRRSFKPAKCKTALKLAVSRIKLLKNKREAHLKQLRSELAQLLQSGHDHTAAIRVEHVVREEKTMAAYDFIEIYCEVIAARLLMIESHKKCPTDMKEAISSVIFASPRCSDIPELIDVQKHIMAKYGKEFVASAVELRPDCGVNHLLVEKLSAKAPDGPTKIKILTSIAEEHGVKWQPKQFGENDAQSSQDLVAGPNTFEKATYVETPQVHVPPVQYEKGPPNLHAFYQLKEIDIPTNSNDHSASVATRKSGGDHSKTSGGSNPEIRSSVIGSQEKDFRDSFGENSSAFPLGRQNWSMEFKDAASAAQAAAECAEHASMAARAAIQLSNREKLTRWYSSGPHSSSGSESIGEVPQEYAFHAGKSLSTGSVYSTFHRSSFGKHNEQNNVREQDYQFASQTSSSAFGDDNPFANGSPLAYIYPHNNSFKQENSDFLPEVSTKKQVSRTEVDFVTELHADVVTKNNDRIGDARLRTNRQFSKTSSSHFVIPIDDHSDYAFVVDKGHNRQESGLFFSSPPGGKSEIEPLSNTNAWSPGQAIDRKESSSSSESRFSVVSETLTKCAVSSGKEDSFPDIFDDPDGPSSDSDEDLVKPVSRNFGYGNSVVDQRENHVASGTSSSRSDEKVASDRKPWFSPCPSSVGSGTEEEHFERKVSIASASEKNFGFGHYDSPIRHASFSERISTVSGYNRPPYTKSRSVELEHRAFQNEQYSLPQRASAPLKTGTSSSLKDASSSKASNFDGGVPSQSQERPSHVHPKLPDYESLTAYFLSLKKGRQ